MKEQTTEDNETVNETKAEDLGSTTETTKETVEKTEAPKENETLQQSKVKRFFKGYWRKKKWTLPVTILVILLVLLLIPVTRFALVGGFWQEKIVITVYDSQNRSRVTQATVKIDGKSVQTDSNGQAKVGNVHVGNRSLNIEKKYYKTATTDVTVDVFASGMNYDVSLEATGRLNKVTVTNRISGGLAEGVLIDAGEGNRARTDKTGTANVIIPADKQTLPVTISGEGYLKASTTIEQGKANALQLVPSGKMYFLSKASGKIDVVKANYDGTDRQTIVAGTGQEDDNATSLLASRDWKYLLLKSKREASKKASLYLVSTTDGSMSLIDQGDAEFTLIGWSGHRFIYKVERANVLLQAAKRQALKSVNAENKQLTTIDENEGRMDQPDVRYQQIDNFYILDNQLSYTKAWFSSTGMVQYSGLNERQTTIMSVVPDGTNKKTLKSFPADQVSYISAKLYEPQEVYYQVQSQSGGSAQYFELEGSTFKGIANDESTFNRPYPTFLLSPDGLKTFWSEARDGKNTLFLGGKNAEDPKELSVKSEFTPYGWMTDDYLLMQKGNSELYITTKSQLEKGSSPLKISDYHKPGINYAGYGYGYGGQ